MNNLTSPVATKLTIRGLREYLDNQEMNWTLDDESFLGKFEDQTINVPYYPAGTLDEGFGPAKITYYGGLDFVIVQAK
jgi:hypothetical protein